MDMVEAHAAVAELGITGFFINVKFDGQEYHCSVRKGLRTLAQGVSLGGLEHCLCNMVTALTYELELAPRED